MTFAKFPLFTASQLAFIGRQYGPAAEAAARARNDLPVAVFVWQDGNRWRYGVGRDEAEAGRYRSVPLFTRQEAEHFGALALPRQPAPEAF